MGEKKRITDTPRVTKAQVARKSRLEDSRERLTPARPSQSMRLDVYAVRQRLVSSLEILLTQNESACVMSNYVLRDTRAAQMQSESGNSTFSAKLARRTITYCLANFNTQKPTFRV